jgi:ATP-dependent DNA helicase RecG
MGKTPAAIVQAMRVNPKITVPELAENLKLSTSAIEKQVRQLRENNIIERIGSTKSGHWEVLK